MKYSSDKTQDSYYII